MAASRYETLDRSQLAVLVPELLLIGHLIDRAGMIWCIDKIGQDEMTQIAIEEWMAASPVYTRRMQRALGFEGTGVVTIFKGIQLDIGAPPQFMDFRYTVHDDRHGEFHLDHCGALMDVEPMGDDMVRGMCHDIEDPTFDATAVATNPKARVRPVHRPPRVPADQHPHCRWTVTIDDSHPPVSMSAGCEELMRSGAAGVELAPIDPSDDGKSDYRGPLLSDLDFTAFSKSALVRMADEACLQMHLLNLGFIRAVRARTDEATAREICVRQLAGLAGLASERIARALGLPASAPSVEEGTLRVLELHPLLNPAAYVDAAVGDGQLTVSGGSPAYEDGAWISLCGPDEPRPLAAAARGVDPHVTVEYDPGCPDGPGSSGGWTARVAAVPDAVPECEEVAVTRFSTGASFSFQPRKSIPVTPYRRTVPMFNLSTVFDTVARAVPDREMLVWRDRRLTYREMNERITHLAHYLAAQGLGCRTPRSELGGHESGQSHLGLYLRNGNEYLEGMVASYRARIAPFNINYRYVEEELLYLLSDAGTEALIYHAEFAPQVAGIRDRLPGLKVLIQVPDASGNALLPGAVEYGSALTEGAARREPLPDPSGDDLYLLYTGGTTGMPKGVLWRQHDAFIAAMGGIPVGGTAPRASYEEIATEASGADPLTMLQIAPLMHGAAQWSAFHLVTAGSKVVLPDDPARLDWPAILRVAEREKVLGLLLVGDAMARPMLEALQRGDYDLSGMMALTNGGAPLTPAVRSAILEALPHIMILDMVGASEAGVQVNQVSMVGAEAEAGVFTPDASATVLDAGLTRELAPGEGEGWLARSGHVPLGYLGDEAKTARTFPVIGGRRYSVPGDRAELLGDGRIRLLGRENTTINSGGEKIFAEEVERALAAHPSVRDVIVVPRPSEKWGSEVAAIVALREDRPVTDAELLEECGRHLARYKVPKVIIRRPEILRSPSGKPDYRWARQQA